jgi:hypothetical protein
MWSAQRKLNEIPSRALAIATRSAAAAVISAAPSASAVSRHGGSDRVAAIATATVTAKVKGLRMGRASGAVRLRARELRGAGLMVSCAKALDHVRLRFRLGSAPLALASSMTNWSDWTSTPDVIG